MGAFSVAWAEEAVNITTGEWVPYSSKELKHNGVVCRVTTEAFAMEGIKVKWSFYPWKRAYEVAKRGKNFDGSIFWYYNEDRAKHFVYSSQIATQSNVFFHLKDYKFNWSAVDDLKDIPIGLTLGYSYGEEFDAANKSGILKTQEVAQDEINFKKLFGGRIKLFPMQMDIGYDLLHRKFTPEQIESLTYHPKFLNNDPVYLIITKKNQRAEHLVKLFDQGLKKLKESGKYEQYFEEVAQGYYLSE